MNIIALHEAVSSTALSHGAGHDCTVCRAARGDSDAFAGILMAALDREHDPLPGAPKPGREALETHARKYGSEGVEDVARSEGLDVEIPTQTTPRRRRRT